MNPQQLEENHRLEASERLSLEAKKHFKFIEFDSNEELVTEIRKHPIGLVYILLIGGMVIGGTMLLMGLTAAANLDSFFSVSNLNGSKGAIVALLSIVLILAVIGTLIGVFLYRSNVIFVTSEKIAQVQYASLFNRKISQLSIGDVQDVTVTQKGILAHLFNYGVLVVETAGEQQNYTFSFVPKPYERSKDIVGAHERNLVQYGN